MTTTTSSTESNSHARYGSQAEYHSLKSAVCVYVCGCVCGECLGHTDWWTGLTFVSILRGLSWKCWGAHMQCQGLNPGKPCARQVSSACHHQVFCLLWELQRRKASVWTNKALQFSLAKWERSRVRCEQQKKKAPMLELSLVTEERPVSVNFSLLSSELCRLPNQWWKLYLVSDKFSPSPSYWPVHLGAWCRKGSFPVSTHLSSLFSEAWYLFFTDFPFPS